MAEYVAVFSAAVVALGTTAQIVVALRKERRTHSRSAFDEALALKSQYQQKAEDLERKVDALMAKITQLEERAWRLEQENFQLRLEISKLHPKPHNPVEGC